MASQIIHIRREAPPKPSLGAPCNGCGVCCAAETCPVGRLRFWRRHGPCPALEWEGSRYVCGLLQRPTTYFSWLPRSWENAARRALARWIAAGQGCDSTAICNENAHRSSSG